MNQRLELVVDTTLDNRTYRLMIPFGAPYEDAFTVLDSFKVELTAMQETAKQQADQAKQQTEPSGPPEASWK